MTVTITPRAVLGEDTTARQSVTTPSFTPAANSKLYIAVGAIADPDGVTISANTGGLTFSKVGESSKGGSGQQTILFEADVGASPSSMTATIDAGTGTATAFLSYSVFDVVSDVGPTQIKSGQIAFRTETKGGGDTESHTTAALPQAASAGNTTIACFTANSDSSGIPATPSGWSVVNVDQAFVENIAVFSLAGFTGTTVTCTDLGDQVWEVSSVIFEIEEFVSGGTPSPPHFRPVLTSRGTSW